MINFTLKKVQANGILKSSLSIGLITLLSKIIGYLEKIILAFYWGTTYKTDIYNVITTIIISVFIFFREIIEPGFLPVFLKAMKSENRGDAWALFNKVGKYIIILTLSLSILVFFYPQLVIELFAPGFVNEKKSLTIKIIQVAFPACIFLSLSALTNITLNGLKKFFLPASGDLAFKIIVLLSLSFLYKYYDIYSIAYGLIVGAFIKLLIHCCALFNIYSFPQITLPKSYIKDSWRLTWPLIIGVSFSQISNLVDNIFASRMTEGTLSALSYSKRIIELPVIIFPYILSVVIFPYFSELAVTKELEKLSRLFLNSLSWIVLIFIPLSVFINVFSNDIVRFTFERGAFDRQSTLLTAYPLSVYSYGLVFFAIETILVIFYFANSNTKTPIFVGILCVVINIILSYILINITGYVGIALALVISKSIKVLALLLILKRRFIISFYGSTYFILKVLLASGIIGFFFYFSKILIHIGFVNLNWIQNLLVFTSLLMGIIIYVILIFALKLNKVLAT